MATTARYTMDEIHAKIVDILVEEHSIPREFIKLDSSIVLDLGIDSLETVELVMELEEEFDAKLDDDSEKDTVYKSIFINARTVRDLVDVCYIRQGSGCGSPPDEWYYKRDVRTQSLPPLTFLQLEGEWIPQRRDSQWLWEPLDADSPYQQYRRQSDGMRCVLVPAAEVEIGSENGDEDESPHHVENIEAFLIDAEPVSTTAYCRFLNSIAPVTDEQLTDWFILQPGDKRVEHLLIAKKEDKWLPLPGAECLPMVLVSWYGANAYSLWANARNWNNYKVDDGPEGSFLPTESQWEYAARGPKYQEFPWGNAPATIAHMQYGQHVRRETYSIDTLPITPVNVPLGVSPFGLLHMAGNVWQWCRNWYRPTSQQTHSQGSEKPAGTVRAERGGSWIGPAFLCRSSYRRGRNPYARGRCLGFRCISPTSDLQRQYCPHIKTWNNIPEPSWRWPWN